MGGAFWLGAGLFSTFLLAPALMKAGPMVAGQVMVALQQRKMFTVLPIVAILTMLSGLRLMMIVSAGDAHWFQHRSGHTYAISGALSILAFVVSLVVSRPAMTKAGKLSQATASDDTSRKLIQDEVRKLQRRGAVASMAAMIMLTLAAVGMSIARYL